MYVEPYVPVAPTDRRSIRRRSGKGAGSPQGGWRGLQAEVRQNPHCLYYSVSCNGLEFLCCQNVGSNHSLAGPVAALVSMSKTLNRNYFVLRMGRKAGGPVCCVNVRKITQDTYREREGAWA